VCKCRHYLYSAKKGITYFQIGGNILIGQMQFLAWKKVFEVDSQKPTFEKKKILYL